MTHRQLCSDMIGEIASYLPMPEVARLSKTSISFMQAFLSRFTRVGDKYLILTSRGDINDCNSELNAARTKTFFVGAIITEDSVVVPFATPVYDLLYFELYDRRVGLTLTNRRTIDNDRYTRIWINKSLYSGTAFIPSGTIFCYIPYHR